MTPSRFAPLIALLCLCSVSSLRAQEGHWSIGVSSSLDQFNNSFNDRGFYGLDFAQQPQWNLNLGVEAIFEFDMGLEVRSGITLVTRGFHYEFQHKHLYPDNVHFPGDLNYLSSYAEVPLRVGYRILDTPKFKIAPVVGASVSVQLGELEETTHLDGEIETSRVYDGFEGDVWGASARLALEYFPIERIMVQLTPYYQYYFNDFDDNIMEGNPTMTGATLSVLYRLRSRSSE